MEHLISKILIRHFNLPDNCYFVNLYFHPSNYNFDIAFKFKMNINEKEEKEFRFELSFQNDQIVINEELNKFFDKDLIDFSFVANLEEEKEQAILFFNKMFNNLLTFDDFDITTRIRQQENNRVRIISNAQSKHTLKEKNSKQIYLDLENEVIEYYIRDYIFIETGLIIHKGIEYFISAFHNTNCFISLEDEKVSFSDDFKSFIKFKNQDDVQEVIDLLKINHAF